MEIPSFKSLKLTDSKSFLYCISFIIFALIINILLQENSEPDKKVFTSEQLSQYTGSGNKKDGENKIYLAILGKIYDVTKGSQHYGPGAPYHVFVGRDVSRAFVTGDFNEDKLTDAVLDLPESDLKSLKDWSKFYEDQYEYKGKLEGRFYDALGEPTPYTSALEERFEESALLDISKTTLKQMYPPCNVEWDSEKGTRVWCSKKSGGIARHWIGVPRKLFEPGHTSFRCACISPEHLYQGNIEEYLNCGSDQTSCYLFE